MQFKQNDLPKFEKLLCTKEKISSTSGSTAGLKRKNKLKQSYENIRDIKCEELFLLMAIEEIGGVSSIFYDPYNKTIWERVFIDTVMIDEQTLKSRNEIVSEISEYLSSEPSRKKQNELLISIMFINFIIEGLQKKYEGMEVVEQYECTIKGRDFVRKIVISFPLHVENKVLNVDDILQSCQRMHKDLYHTATTLTSEKALLKLYILVGQIQLESIAKMDKTTCEN